ncbi:MAG TPA: small metal-binding protein SmbP [Nitrosomonas sp.]|nr:small metal-binding protein SmbP [Nitrosomonas sp.]
MIKKLLLNIIASVMMACTFQASASFGPFPQIDHLTQAIVQTYFAIHASDAKTIVQHAQTARGHANTIKSVQHEEVDHFLLEQSIDTLNVVVEEGSNGNLEAARAAAHAALILITRSAK